MDKNSTIWAKKLGSRWDRGGCTIKGGQAQKLEILGMDNNIIVLARFQRNIIEKVKLCKVFWWFGLIKSTWFQIFKAIDYIFPT